MEPDHTFELRKLEFETSIALRNFEIDNFWKRGWFFGALVVLLAGGYYQLNQEYSIYLAFLGLLVSFFQTLMNRGSKYWHERWENKTKNRESILGIDVTLTKKYNAKERYYIDAGILAKNENGLTVARRISVSKLTFLIWDILTISWLFLWLKSWEFNFRASIRWETVIYHAAIILYILCFFFWKPNPKRKIKRKSWYSFIKKGGGKVCEGFKTDDNMGKPENVREPFFTDSESYYTNRI